MLNQAKIKAQKQNFYGLNREAMGRGLSSYSYTFQEGRERSSAQGRQNAVKRHVMDIKDRGSLERLAWQIRQPQDMFWQVHNVGGIRSFF